ncbi:amidohydrolase [Cellulomonas sp. P22]|uniref:amidohydrolase n=1 Tax=Cellulomonas sp. P22 TaxID=3373189 RepID=UPI0037A8FD5D
MDELLLTRARVASVTADGVRVHRPRGEPVDVHVRDGRVVAVAAGLDAAVPSRVPRVDLDGRVVLPGLWDAHVHLGQWALARRRLDVSGASSAAAAAQLVTARLSGGFDEDVLVGFGFRDGLWPDRPTAALLDAAAERAGRPRTPVVVVAADLHCAWLSTAALEHYGVQGHPDGVLRETDWFGVGEVVSLVPDPLLDAWVAEATRAAAARGVVGVVDFEIADNLTAWRRRIPAGDRSLRVEAAVWPGHLDRVVAEELQTGDVVLGTGGLLTMGPLKVITDGSLNTRTAYCDDPYPGMEGDGARGVLSVPTDELVLLMAHAHRKGLRCAVHAIGDTANALALDAFEASGARGSIEHAQLVEPDDVRRFVDLRVVASVQPEHAMDDRDVADRFWAGRTDRAFAYATLADAGVRLAFGSDAPVAPLDPWAAISAAVTRSRDGREPWHPEQSVDLDVALGASVRSRVEPGQVADLVVLDIDPWVVPDPRDMVVAATMLGGRWTWEAL